MKHILVIDDDDQFRLLLKRILERAGYSVSDAVDGRKGLQAFRNRPADVVITDLIMPEKEGLETIAELHRDFPQVPIIAISGGGRIAPGNYLSIAKQLGAVKAFEKPLDRPRLLATLKSLVGG